VIRKIDIHKLLPIILVLLLIDIHLYFFIQGNFENLKTFFNYQAVPKEKYYTLAWGEYYKSASVIKETTPADSLIILPSQNSTFVKRGIFALCSYFIFPRVAVYENSKKIPFYNGPVYRIHMEPLKYNGFSLSLLRGGNNKNRSRLIDYSDIKSTYLNSALALLKLLLIIMSGLFIALKCFQEQTPLGLFATSFLAGTTMVTVFYIFFSLMGINFTELFQFIFLGALSIPGIIFMTKYKGLINYFKNKQSHTYSKQGFIIVGLFFFLIFLKSFSTAPLAVDALSVWGVKAKAIFAFGNLKELNNYGAHPWYPPLLPILMSQVAMGGEKMVKLIFPLFAICLYVNIYEEILNTKLKPIFKVTLPLLLFTTTVFLENSLEACADLALAVFVTKAITILPKLLNEQSYKRWLSLSLVLCGLVLVRPDGYAYFFYIALLVWLWSCFKNRNPRNLLYLLIPLAIGLFWKLYSKFIFDASGNDIMVTPIINVSRFNLIIKYFTKHLLSPAHFGMIIISFILVCLFKRRNIIKRYFLEFLFIIMAIVGLILFYYYVTPFWDIQYLISGRFIRYFIILIPIIFIILLKEIDTILIKP